MGADLRIVVKPAGRAATVDNARLQGLHIVRCDCHGAIRCPSLDTRARLNEGAGLIPVGYTGEDIVIAPQQDGLALILWAAVCTGALLTGYSVGAMVAEWVLS